jgi:hypothetical protein
VVAELAREIEKLAKICLLPFLLAHHIPTCIGSDRTRTAVVKYGD